MVNKNEALKLALEALTYIHSETSTEEDVLIDEAITAINEALDAQPAKEPVVFYRCKGCAHAYEGMLPSSCDCMAGAGFERVKYFTTPPQRPWVGLTDEEIWKDDGIMAANSGYGATFETLREVIRAVEAKLKEKNT